MPLNNPFLKATPLYKEYAILDLLSENSNLTQRVMAKELDSSLSMINQYLEEYEARDLIQRDYISQKKIDYTITQKGILRLKELNIRYLESIRRIYLGTKGDIVKFLKQIVYKGYKSILMYGAGEVAELILQVLLEEKDLPLVIRGVIDDDVSKQGTKIMGIPIFSKDEVNLSSIDGVFISSYGHSKTIKKKLLELSYDKNLIFDYFE